MLLRWELVSACFPPSPDGLFTGEGLGRLERGEEQVWVTKSGVLWEWGRVSPRVPLIGVTEVSLMTGEGMIKFPETATVGSSYHPWTHRARQAAVLEPCEGRGSGRGPVAFGTGTQLAQQGRNQGVNPPASLSFPPTELLLLLPAERTHQKPEARELT